MPDTQSTSREAARPTLKVERAMVLNPLVLPADIHVREACALMRRRAAEEVLVMPSAWSPSEAPVLPIGILTESDALELLTRRPPPLDVPLSDVMSHPVHSVSADDDLSDALSLMHQLRIHRMPVVARGTLVGLLTSESVLEAQSAHLHRLNRHAERLEEEVLHDPLTGLANRRLFEEVLERELSPQRRPRLPLGVLMIDVDHFKSINDTRGHAAGDHVLRQLAGRLRDSTRRADLLARVGGEEFAVLATVESDDQLRQFAEKLRSAVAARPFVVPERLRTAPSLFGAPEAAPARTRELAVTISLGGALLPAREGDARELVHLADQALYAAKHAGRNTVSIA